MTQKEATLEKKWKKLQKKSCWQNGQKEVMFMTKLYGGLTAKPAHPHNKLGFRMMKIFFNTSGTNV